MKYGLIAFLLAFAACASNPTPASEHEAVKADTSNSAQSPQDLKANMKAMGARFKKLNEQVGKPEVNAENATLASEIQALAVSGQKFSPKILNSMSQAEQKKAKADFDEGLNIEAKLAGELSSAFKANDNAKAKDLLKQMNDTRKYGHDTYKK